ncbi:MAG: hypothetical protein PF442_13350 [Desulfobulbaceae bacterium]|jgi:hypothetical protein|nr:hypothetical protein [Desulfobulbaceae bacterium]
MLKEIKAFAEGKIPKDEILKAKKYLRYLKGFYLQMRYYGNLKKLARHCKTDKESKHFYTQHYHRHFGALRKKKMNVLEIGIGGYDRPGHGGKSLRMWKYYFPRSNIFGIDIYDKSGVDERRIKTFKGSQNKPSFLKDVVAQIGHLDIIIDDGSHVNEHVITSFKTLFPLLSDTGIYVIEDTQTSYWSDYGGNSENFNDMNNMIGFFKSLVDGLNYEEYKIDNYYSSYFDEHIVSISFYHNLIFIQKGSNKEGSNLN